MRRFLNKPLRILLATNAFVLVAGAMLGPIYAIFVDNVGGDLMDASIAGGLYALAAGVTTLISGKYSDKIRESEYVVVLGYVIMGIGFLFYTMANSIWWLFVLQSLIGMGEAIYSPAFDAVYSHHLVEEKAGGQWGAWESMNYFSLTIGSFVGGSIATWFGFNTLFIIMSLLCFGSALYIFRLPRRAL